MVLLLLRLYEEIFIQRVIMQRNSLFGRALQVGGYQRRVILSLVAGGVHALLHLHALHGPQPAAEHAALPGGAVQAAWMLAGEAAHHAAAVRPLKAAMAAMMAAMAQCGSGAVRPTMPAAEAPTSSALARAWPG